MSSKWYEQTFTEARYPKDGTHAYAPDPNGMLAPDWQLIAVIVLLDNSPKHVRVAFYWQRELHRPEAP